MFKNRKSLTFVYKQEVLNLYEHLGSTLGFLVESVLVFLVFCVVLFVFVSSFHVLSLMLPVSLPCLEPNVASISAHREVLHSIHISTSGQGHHDIESPDRSAALYTHLNQLVEVIMTYVVLDTAGHLVANGNQNHICLICMGD